MPAAPALDFGKAVAIVNTYLEAALIAAGKPNTFKVVSQVPTTRPTEFVQTSRTGGPEINRVHDGAQITFDCWSTSESAAEDLARLVRRLMANMEATVQSGRSIHRVTEVGGPGKLPDPASGQARWALTMQVQIRGLAA